MRTVLISLVAILAVSCSKAHTESIALTNKGIKAYQANQLEEAITLFNAAVTRNPKNDQALFQLGMIFMYDKQAKDDAEKARLLDTAESFLNQALAQNAKNADVLFQLGRLALTRNEIDSALNRFQEAAQFNPNLAAAFYWAGQCLEKKGKLSDADDQYRKAI
ncbi:MAG TPA: tetratricopeptide repeat protein, partial [Myxococcota bacterium]|nr:tetratricopeptide repeat protein [Myxococcota bacterium]